METLRGIYEAVELNHGEIFDFRSEQIKANKANFNLPDLCHIAKECKAEQNVSKGTPTGYYHYVLGFEYFDKVESIKKYTRDLIDRQFKLPSKKTKNESKELKLKTVTISTYNPFSQLDVRFTVQVQDVQTQRKENSEFYRPKQKETKRMEKGQERTKQKEIGTETKKIRINQKKKKNKKTKDKIMKKKTTMKKKKTKKKRKTKIKEKRIQISCKNKLTILQKRTYLGKEKKGKNLKPK